MITFDESIMMGSMKFKRMFCLNGFFGSSRLMGSKMEMMAGMINKESPGMMFIRCWRTAMCGNHARSTTLNLIARYAIPGI
jgi:hypothetical protein